MKKIAQYQVDEFMRRAQMEAGASMFSILRVIGLLVAIALFAFLGFGEVKKLLR